MLHKRAWLLGVCSGCDVAMTVIAVTILSDKTQLEYLKDQVHPCSDLPWTIRTIRIISIKERVYKYYSC